MPDTVPPEEQFVDMSFPTAGIDLLRGYSQQMPRQIPSGDQAAAADTALKYGQAIAAQMPPMMFARTCRDAVNVRGYEALTQRLRGGSRPGLTKYIPTAPVAGWMLQELNTVVTTSASNKS